MYPLVSAGFFCYDPMLLLFFCHILFLLLINRPSIDVCLFRSVELCLGVFWSLYDVLAFLALLFVVMQTLLP